MPDKDILGIGEMQGNFAKLRDEVKNRTSRRMVVAAGNVLKRKAKQIAQSNGSVRTGAMVKNIAIKREAQAGGDTTQYHLGVRHGRNLTGKAKKNSKLAVASSGRIVKRYQDDPYYWRFVEFRTVKAAPKPFLGPALEQGKAEAIEAMNDRLLADLAKVGNT